MTDRDGRDGRKSSLTDGFPFWIVEDGGRGDSESLASDQIVIGKDSPPPSSHYLQPTQYCRRGDSRSGTVGYEESIADPLRLGDRRFALQYPFPRIDGVRGSSSLNVALEPRDPRDKSPLSKLELSLLR